MKKVIDLLKKYFVIGLVLSSIMFTWLIFSNPIPTINLLYILKQVFAILVMAVILVPPIAFVDWLLIRTYKSIFDDFKNADKSGRITIIIVSIGLFIKMIYEWDR